ncbi:UNVERIFIED_CONTAM: hypothetical protein PYX00_011576 [Menopon gallinae]|uniref:Uncharacterized protein n=1 Tax=Menopon gallinae TaxID=328185 RepID=A0AAW2H7U6_9NEOP
MIVNRSLVIQYLFLYAAETGFYVYYARDIVNFYYGQSKAEGLNIFFSELSLSATRVLSDIALCNAVINDSLESFYVYVGLKITIFAKLLIEIPLPHHFRYPFIYYLVPLIAQIIFVAANYDTITRNALWKYYKTIGSSLTLQTAYNLEGIRHIIPYFYTIALLDSLFCFYEAREVVLYKFASLALIAGMIVYLAIIFAWYIRLFEENEIGTLIFDIVRAAIYLPCSLADYLYYGSGLKEIYYRGR